MSALTSTDLPHGIDKVNTCNVCQKHYKDITDDDIRRLHAANDKKLATSAITVWPGLGVALTLSLGFAVWFGLLFPLFSTASGSLPCLNDDAVQTNCGNMRDMYLVWPTNCYFVFCAGLCLLATAMRMQWVQEAMVNTYGMRAIRLTRQVMIIAIVWLAVTGAALGWMFADAMSVIFPLGLM